MLKEFMLIEETKEMDMAIGFRDGDSYPEISNFGDEGLELELQLRKLEQLHHHRFHLRISNALAFYTPG